MKGGELLETARDWSSVPGDLLRQIAKRFESIEDYVRFGAVCWSWHSSSTSSLNYDKPKFLPWLMLTEKEDSDMRGFYNLSTDKVFEIQLPEIRGRKCWGSPFGWLITIGLDLEIHLFNPLSRARLPLPPQRTFTDQFTYPLSPENWRDGFCRRILLSSDPSSSDCIAMTIYSGPLKLAFAKPGDDAWRPIQCDRGGFNDMIYFDGHFYAGRNAGNLFICEGLYGDHPHPVAVEFAGPPPGQLGRKKYLVDLGGHLCMVCRHNVRIQITYDDREEVKLSWETDNFVIFKLDMHTRIWEPVLSLGDWCLFLGNNYSFSTRASDHSRCRYNCIYFTDDYWEFLATTLGSDMGNFSYENKEVDYFPDLPDMESSSSPPLWITPCLQ